MSESHQPADDHAEQPQEAAGHQKEVHHCQTGTGEQPSSSTQVKLKTTSSQIFVCSTCFITRFLYIVLSCNLNGANDFSLDGAAT